MDQTNIASEADYRYRNDPAFHAFVDICVMLGTPVTVSPSVNEAMRASATESVAYALVLLGKSVELNDMIIEAVKNATGAGVADVPMDARTFYANDSDSKAFYDERTRPRAVIQADMDLLDTDAYGHKR